MAKVAMVERNEKRKRMINRDAGKRAALKAIVMDKEKSIEERFEAQMKLSKLPRNGAKIRYRNRCELTGRPRGCLLYTSPSPRDRG